MPELPEVQTTVNGLNKTVKGRKIFDVWTDYKPSSIETDLGRTHVRHPKFFKEFKKKVVGAKITGARRRAKNILIDLSNKETILIHMKMTGHLMYGKYKLEKKEWRPTEEGPLKDPFNKFIHFVLIFDNGRQLVFSDMRKFAKVSLIETKEESESRHLKDLGPEPLDENFDYKLFKSRIYLRPGGKIKQVLMDQSLIAGIGNIYSDEILWRSNVHPMSIVEKIPENNLKLMYKATLETLKRGIDFGGDSMSDYRNIYGERGKFQEHHRAYRRTGKPCTKSGCKGVIKRAVVGGRSAHFCSVHQELFK